MKILHTSDWHIGRLFHNVSLLEDQAHILLQIVAYAVAEHVDAVIIAGDIFDRAIPPAAAVALLDETLHSLTLAHGIPVVMISGNHDSAERLAFGSRLLANQKLHILHSVKQCDQAVMLQNASGETLALYGIPYHTPEHIRSEFNETVTTFDQAHSFLANKINVQPKSSDFRVLISHCFIDGASECESERPLAIGGADRVSYEPLLNFDYVALGHLHGQQKRGAEHIRYSGSPLKYSFSESPHKKSVTLVELKQGSAAKISLLPLTPLRDVRCLEGEINTLIDAAKTDPKRDDYLAITLTDKHAILDAMGKLRAHYPNVLQLEKTFLTQSAKSQSQKAQVQQSALTLFEDFFVEVTGEPLTPAQQTAMTTLINAIAADKEPS